MRAGKFVFMLDKKYLQSVREDLLGYAVKRRDVIKVAGDAQQMAKKAIFAMQRDDKEAADQLIKTALGLLAELNKKYKTEKDLFTEGSYRAALEEYTEAALFRQYLLKQVIGKMKGLEIDSDTLVGGLCDLPGELCRYAIKSATERDFVEVKKCFATAEEIVAELVDMDLTGYSRQKFDQAKQSLHKLEHIVYEVSMKR